MCGEDNKSPLSLWWFYSRNRKLIHRANAIFCRKYCMSISDENVFLTRAVWLVRNLRERAVHTLTEQVDTKASSRASRGGAGRTSHLPSKKQVQSPDGNPGPHTSRPGLFLIQVCDIKLPKWDEQLSFVIYVDCTVEQSISEAHTY